MGDIIAQFIPKLRRTPPSFKPMTGTLIVSVEDPRKKGGRRKKGKDPLR